MPNESMYSIIMLVAVFAIMYFIMIRPENKRKKAAEEMRSNVALGDEIVTIGGMTGKIVQVTEETVTFETGEDRVRIQIQTEKVMNKTALGSRRFSVVSSNWNLSPLASIGCTIQMM